MENLTAYERYQYEKMSEKFPNCVISWENLRLESANFTAAQGSIPFAVLQQDNATIGAAPTATEIRLNQNDCFLATRMAIYIAKTDGARATTRKRTYPNTAIYVAVNETRNQMAIYNGNTLIAVDKYKYFPAWPNYQHLQSGGGQQELQGTTGVVVAPATISGYTVETFNGQSSGVKAMDPAVLFKGTSDIELTIDLNGSFDLSGGVAINFAIIEFCGFQIQSGNLQEKM